MESLTLTVVVISLVFGVSFTWLGQSEDSPALMAVGTLFMIVGVIFGVGYLIDFL